MQYYSPTTHSYTYGVKNSGATPLEISLDFSSSENLNLSSKGPLVKKVVKPNEIEFMLHAQPGFGNFEKIVSHSATASTKK